MSELAIEATGLVKQFGDKRAVDGIDLTVKQGEIFGILGPNGAGKTTLLRMLATLSRPSAGQAFVFGYDTVKNAGKVRKLIGLTGQYASVDEELTAMENLIIFGQLNGLSKPMAIERANQLLDQFSLTAAKNKAISAFSGGMRRRLDLATSLITRPRLIFLDEPTTGLDPRTRGEMWQVIRDLVAHGSTIVLTTQYLEEADQLADSLVIVDHGKIVADGTSESLKAQLGDTYFEVSLDDPNQLNNAGELIATESGIQSTILSERQSLTIKLQDTRMMTKLLVCLAEHQISVASFNMRKPTLDEVFLELTNN